MGCDFEEHGPEIFSTIEEIQPGKKTLLWLICL